MVQGFQVLKEKNRQQQILYPEKLSFRNERLIDILTRRKIKTINY